MADYASTAPTQDSATGLPEGVTVKKMSESAAHDLEHRLYTQDELQGVTMTRMDAPNNSVFDQDNNRSISLPQGLSETETGFLIKRDADKKKEFFGMQEVGGFEALGQGVKSFFIAQPQAFGTLAIEQGELVKNRNAGGGDIYDKMAPQLGIMGSFIQVGRAARDMTVNFFGADEVIAKSQGIIERNKKYMADAGIERPEQGGVAGVMYDIGQGGSSLLASVGLAALTRSPTTAGLYFGALQKASVYQEARAAGKTPEQASDLSTLAGTVEGALEFVGLDHFIKAMKGNSAVTRFVNGFMIEAVQEGSQQAGEEVITQGGGVRKDKALAQTAQDILYNAALGGILGGGTSVALGSSAKADAKKAGMNDAAAEKLGQYVEKNVDGAKANMTEFIDKELAPIARDEPTAMQFMTLMQKFDNDTDLVNRDSLSPEMRSVFDQYVEMFQRSTTDKTSVQDVEKSFYEGAVKNGVDKDQATAAAKIVGARADAASRALGISPMEWLKSKRLSVTTASSENKKDPDLEEAKIIKESFKAARSIRNFNREDNSHVQKKLALKEKPQSVMQFIKSKGGISLGLTSEELNNVKAARKSKGVSASKSSMASGEPKQIFDGKNNLGQYVNEKGMALDDLYTALVDAGYLEAPVDQYENQAVDHTQEVLDLINKEVNGKKVYTAKVEQALEENRDTRGENIDQLASMGIDESMSEEEIVAVLKKYRADIAEYEAQFPKELADLGDEVLFQSAYHGTPHRFDKFTLDHIGSGEGAQAYGWGLYFAGKKSIAEWYHDKLTITENGTFYKGKTFLRPDGSILKVNEDWQDELSNLLEYSVDNDFTIDQAIAKARADRKSASVWQKMKGVGGDEKLFEFVEKNRYKIGSTTGQVYEVKIPEDDVLLLLDKTLEEQSPEVKKSLEAVRLQLEKSGVLEEYEDQLNADFSEWTGKELVKKVLPRAYEDDALPINSREYTEAVRGDEMVSRFLNDTGIKGSKYLDGGSRSRGEGSYNFVIFDDAAVEVIETLYQNEKDPQGQVTFGRFETLIELFKGANPSTLLHELGHVFLRDMRDVAKVTNRPRTRADYETVKKWLGAKGDNLTVAQEEKFARGFEAYLREGKAPKPELQGVFDTFKKWLESIYKSVQQLNVQLTPEIREVFDRMLGGDFAMAEKLNQEAAARSIEADYEKVAAMEPVSTMMPDAKAVFKSASDLSADFFVPVSTRLGNIDAGLKHAVRKFIFNTGLYSHEDRVAIKPFIEKVSNTFSEQDYRVFDLALKNRDTVKVDFLADKYGIQKEWQVVRDTLDGLYNEAEDVGLDINYIEEYFPRKVKKNMASEYMAAMRGSEQWSEIETALKEADPNGTFTPEDQAAFVNAYLRGFSSSRINLARPSYTKERTVDYVTPEFNRFYQDSMPTLMDYIGAMRHGIEARKLFGKSEKETDQNIGAYVLSLVDAGIIKNDQELELKKLLKAVVEPTGSHGAVAWAKNASYVYLMGSPISAITQIQDLAFSLHANGYYRTTKSLLKSLTGNQLLKKEDLGIDNILREFEDETRANRFVRAVFKGVGLEWMDNVGKEVYIESAYGRIVAAAKKGGAEFDAQMESVFGKEAVQTKMDLINGTMSENVKYLLFSELSDVQPISLAEMPVSYLRGGNGRVFYMLKTYTIKQLDLYRREIFANILSTDIKKVGLGLKNLISLAAGLMMMGMGSDALKDLLLGRDIVIDDLITDNLLKLMGFTKYQIYQAKAEGIGNATLRTLFMPPIFAVVDDIGKDVGNIVIGKENKRTGEVTYKDWKDAEVLGKVPVVGKFYYWWWGGGQAKAKKKSKTSTP